MIEIKNVSKKYGDGQIGVNALQDICLEIKQGEFVAIMGASGSGKSTLLHILGFLDQPDSGSYLFNGIDVTTLDEPKRASFRNQTAGFVFQQFHLLRRVSALDNVELPLVYAGKRDQKDKAAKVLGMVGLQDRMTHWPSEMSGGEQQRTAIARALVNDPTVIFADEPTGNLDTQSEAEIIKILKALNKQGKTIILVTHEREMAAVAKRIITMKDGRIERDTIRTDGLGGIASLGRGLKGGRFAGAREEDFVGARNVVFETEGEGVRWGDYLHIAVHSFVSNRLRSFLSSLGILIGVAAVIAMLALGQGARDDIKQQLSSLGSNMLTVRPGARRMHGVSMEAGSVTRFREQDVRAIQKLDWIKRVSPVVSGRVQVVAGSNNWSTRIYGTGTDYGQMRAYVPEIGEFFTSDAVGARRKVVLLGQTVAQELFGEANPINRSVKINRVKFKVIGLLPEKGSSGWMNRDDLVIVPYTTAMYRLLGKEYIDSIDVEVSDGKYMEPVQDAIKQLIIKRHRLTGQKVNSFSIRDMSEIQDMVSSTTKTMSWLLGSIAAISLLVGGIGIMNIMLVSVTERTREIGLRKAVGANAKDIMRQFLIESVVLTLGGGLLGIALGVSIAQLLSLFAGWVVRVSSWSIFLAAGFSVTVGLGFGLWPAKQASRLDPVEALRYE